MRVLRRFRLLAALLMAGSAAQASEPIPIHLSHGRFHDFLVYQPAGAPTSIALLLSGDEGWSATADTMSRQLVQQGAMVVGIDSAKFNAALEADASQCV